VIRGTVNANLEATFSLRLRGPTGTELDVDVVIDTGFSSTLTLPAKTVSALALVSQSVSRAIMANGTVQYYDTYVTDILWDGAWRPVLVWGGVGDETLLGMRLLSGNEIHIDVKPGGSVTIELSL